MEPNQHLAKRFGTAPVCFTAISTILGAILFLSPAICVPSYVIVLIKFSTKSLELL